MALEIRKWIFLLFAIYFMGLGIAMATNAQLGTTPISSLPYVLSCASSMTFGTATFAINVLFFFAQWILLGKSFTKRQFLQLPALFLFALFIDLGMWCTNFMIPQAWILRIAMCVGGCGVLAFGIMLAVYTNTILMPGDGLVYAIAWRSKLNFGNVKILFDSSLVTMAIISSLMIFDTLKGVREGTIISAVITGIFIRIFSRLFGQVLQKLLGKNDIC